MSGAGSHLITFRRRGSGLVLRVDCARWGQTPEDLRHLALSAPHARTRERALALFDITQHRCATQVAVRTGRRAHTVMEGVHAYNQGGPDALTFRRTGGRRPLFSRAAEPDSAGGSPPPPSPPPPGAPSLFCPPPRSQPGGGGRPPPAPGAPPPPPRGLTHPRVGPGAASSIGSGSVLGWGAVGRRSARSCTAASCRGR